MSNKNLISWASIYRNQYQSNLIKIRMLRKIFKLHQTIEMTQIPKSLIFKLKARLEGQFMLYRPNYSKKCFKWIMSMKIK